MSNFWSFWISAITIGTIVACVVLLFTNRKIDKPGETTGHEYDGIQEYDTPIPFWWLLLFAAMVVYSIGYLIVYPGLGKYKGMFGWTSVGQWQAEVDEANKKYGAVYAKYANMPVEEVIKQPAALKMGERLFANNCAQCHGSDAQGAHGFPNLTDSDWLYGGTSETIKTTITNGRRGAMPAKGLNPNMSNEDADTLVQYVLSLSGRKFDTALAEKGKTQFAQACSACHGANGKGNQSLGAPNLTDNIWLYGGTPSMIKHTIINGRNAHMPAHKELLSPEKIHLLTSYVYSLSR